MYPIYTVFSAASLALWPIFRRRTNREGERYARAMLGFALVGIIASVGFVLVADPLIEFATRGVIELGLPLSLAFAILLLTLAIHQPSGMYLTSPRGLAFQAICSLVMLLALVLSSAAIVPRFGAPGVVMCAAASIFFFQAIPAIAAVLPQLKDDSKRGA
jgi:hypothetical protein